MCEHFASSSPKLQKVNHLLNVKHLSQKAGWKYNSWIHRQNILHGAETIRAANWWLQWRCCPDNYHPEVSLLETEIGSFINYIFTVLSFLPSFVDLKSL